MKKVMIIAAAMMTANAYALDISIGDESFELNTDTIALVEANVNTVDSQIDANAIEAYNSIDRTINSADSLNNALSAAMEREAGDINAAIASVADAAATGAADGIDAATVAAMADTEQSVCTSCADGHTPEKAGGK